MSGPPLPLLLLVVLCAAGLCAGSPAPHSRVRRGFPALPGGVPLSVVFELCHDGGAEDTGDIGPCLAEILRGAIETARPNFATGLEIGRDNIVLEPLKLDDVDPKMKKTFQLSVTDLFLHGISTLTINDITFNTEELALNLTFENVNATGNMLLKYIFITANPKVRLELHQLGVHVRAGWGVEINPEDPTRLDIVLSNATANFELNDLKAYFDDLGDLGLFVQRLINKHSKVLVGFLIPELEKNLNKKLNRKLNRIKIVD